MTKMTLQMLSQTLALALFILAGCAHKADTQMTVDKSSVDPGSKVTAGGKETKLYNEGGNIRVGKPIGFWLKELGEDPTKYAGKVMVINIVPSIDTKVCEQQTHILGESKKFPLEAVRLSISRDLPFAQTRFAKEAKLENITYLSDYKTAAFGKTSGLLMVGSELLARAVLVVDKKGIIRHLQVVPNVASLPDMDKAFEIAAAL